MQNSLFISPGEETYPFRLRPLPYPANSLSPFINQETLLLHHGKHLAKYVEELNKALKPYPKYHNWPLTRLLENIILLPREIQTPVLNNGGGVYNHNLYFNAMAPPGSKAQKGHLIDRIKIDFSSPEDFYILFKEKALEVFGSGYTWLAAKGSALKILNTPNQNTVLPLGLYPLFLIDVWEHAYYLQYQNRRGEYIDNFFKLINWQYANANYLNSLKTSL